MILVPVFRAEHWSLVEAGFDVGGIRRNRDEAGRQHPIGSLESRPATTSWTPVGGSTSSWMYPMLVFSAMAAFLFVEARRQATKHGSRMWRSMRLDADGSPEPVQLTRVQF